MWVYPCCSATSLAHDGLTGNFDGASASPAQQVMVVAVGALQTDGLTVFARQDVHVAGVHQESKSPVDGAGSVPMISRR